MQSNKTINICIATRCYYIASLKKTTYVETPLSNANINSCVWLHLSILVTLLIFYIPSLFYFKLKDNLQKYSKWCYATVLEEGAVYRTAEYLQTYSGFTVTFPSTASSSTTFVLNIDNAKAHHMNVPELFRLSPFT
jgi:hypothetical protein